MEGLLARVVNLCKRRGFVFQTAELYRNGLRGCYDYGPLGAALKRNLAAMWWRDIVTRRSDVMPLDTAVLTPRDVLQTSGHLNHFTDPLVDCKLSKERFRADKAPPVALAEGDAADPSLRKLVILASSAAEADAWAREIREQLAPGAWVEREGKKGVVLRIVQQSSTELVFAGAAPTAGAARDTVSVPYAGYVSPSANSPFLTPSRQFNLMFSTTLGPVDPLEDMVDTVLAGHAAGASREQTIAAAREQLAQSLVYLRPETAQGAFSQFFNVVQAMGPKLPFGLAQVGKSFRNEITTDHFIFRTAEFEQMELEYFCAPAASSTVFEYWRAERMKWWRKVLVNNGSINLRFVDHPTTSLAHYSRACTDIEFLYPWGWGELEGVAHRGDYDLQAHGQALGTPMAVLDADGVTRVVPHAVEPAAGLNRGVLAVLLDAYTEEAKGATKRTLLRLHPQLAPIKVAVLPLRSGDDKAVQLAQELAQRLQQRDVVTRVDLAGSIGRRYARHDEIGTPWCITIDPQSLEDRTVTVRERDSTLQRRVQVDDVVAEVTAHLVV